jgi:hypothetical protein
MDMNDPIMQAVMKQCVGVNGLYTTNKDAKHDDNIKREEHGEEVHHN